MLSSINIDGWKNNISFSSGHILSDHEKCGFLHGHSYAIHSKIYGEMDKQGFITDFSVLKKILREIADKLDHRMLIPEKNIHVIVKETEINIKLKDKKYTFPKEDCVILPIKNTTVENIALYILDELLNRIDLSKNIKRIEIGVDEGIGQGVFVGKTVG